jgi:hypothetical protein
MGHYNSLFHYLHSIIPLLGSISGAACQGIGFTIRMAGAEGDFEVES